MEGRHRLRRNYERIQILQLFWRNDGDAHKAHEVLDALQVGLPDRSTLGHLRRGWWCGILGILAAIDCLGCISKKNRDEEGVGNQQSQPREEVLGFSPGPRSRLCAEI